MKFRPTDKISFIYLAFNIIYMILGYSRVHNALLHLSIFILFAVGIFLLVAFPARNKFLIFLRDWYPIILSAYFFEATSAMNLVIIPEFTDVFFQKIDMMIFGYQPAIEWGAKLDNFVVQEIMHFAYFSYYALIPIVGFFIYNKSKETFHKFMFAMSFVYYICLIIYSILPVIGGRYWEITMELTKIYRYGIFTRVMAYIYSHTTHLGGAFPSSHVAIAVAVSIAAVQHHKKTGYLVVFITFLLSLSTVYCHYHYFIDTIFGIIFGIALFLWGQKIYTKAVAKEC